MLSHANNVNNKKVRTVPDAMKKLSQEDIDDIGQITYSTFWKCKEVKCNT